MKVLEVKYSTRFKKDLKVCQKRHYNMALLQQVINVLVLGNLVRVMVGFAVYLYRNFI